MQDEMEEDHSENLLSAIDSSSPDKDAKVMSRELKSLINSAKESKIINESTQIVNKIRKSRKDLFESSQLGSPSENTTQSRASSANSSSSELSQQKDGKRSMRSQNFEFVIKQKKFLKAVSGKSDWVDEPVETDIDEASVTKSAKSATKSERPTLSMAIKMSLERFGSRVDPFCWRCHREDAPLHCSNCPRSFHQRCLAPGTRPPAPDLPWACEDCVIAMHAGETSKRSPALKKMTIAKFCELLKYAIRRMIDVKGSEPFITPVDPELFPDYSSYVVNPTDLSKLQENISRRLYGSTEAFTSDARWILHNCIIFNSLQSKLTNVSRAIMKTCRQEMKDIETCSECYLNANTKSNWFIQVCEHPHILLWAKLKSFPYWPAKGMAYTSGGMVDVRFFGAHDRAWVPVRDCFLYSQRDPNLNNKNKKNEIQQAIMEVQQYIANIKLKFGAFNHAPFKTQYIPSEEENQLKILIPNYNSPEGYKHPNFSTISPQSTSPAKPNSPGYNAVSNDVQDKCSTPVKMNLQPKVMLSPYCDSQRTRQVDGYDSEVDSLMLDEDNPSTADKELRRDSHESMNDSKSNHDTSELNGNSLVISADIPEKGSEVESVGLRKRRTLSESSGIHDVSDPKKSKKSKEDEKEVRPKVPPMRSRGKSIDSRTMMTAYMSAIENNETNHIHNFTEATKKVQVPNSESNNEETAIVPSADQKNDGVSSSNLPPLKPKAGSAVENIKVVNICSLSKSAPPEKPPSPPKTNGTKLLLCKKNVSENTPDSYTIGVVTVDNNCPSPQNLSPKTVLNVAMEKLNSLKKFNALTVNQKIPGVVNVKPLAKTAGANPSVNGKPSLNAKKPAASDTIITANVLNTGVKIKEEPMDANELEERNIDKNRLLNSLQLKPNEAAQKNVNKTTFRKEPVGSSSSPPKVAKGVIKKYKTAAEMKDDNIKLMDNVILTSVPKPPNNFRIRKIAPKPGNSICQIKSVSGNTITLDANSPKGPAVNGGVAKPAASETLASNQMVCIPPVSADVSKPETSVITTTLKTNNIIAAPKMTVLNSLAGINIPLIHNPSLSTSASALTTRSSPVTQTVTTRLVIPVVTTETSTGPSSSGVLSDHVFSTPLMSSTVVTQSTNNPHLVTIPLLQMKGSCNAFDGAPPESVAHLLPSVVGPQQKWVNDSAAKLSDYFRHLMNESLNSLAIQGSPEAMIRTLQLQVERIKWQSEQKIKELRHTMELSLKEIRNCLDGEKQRKLNEQRLTLEAEKIAAVSETKKIQWCAQCERPSQFYCCWNTSYCGYPCQQAHWPTHMKTCTQPAKDSTPNRQPVIANSNQLNSRGKKQVIIARTAIPSMVAQTITQAPLLDVASPITVSAVASKPNTFKVMLNPSSVVTTSTSTPQQQQQQQVLAGLASPEGPEAGETEPPTSTSGKITSTMYILGT